MTDATIAACLVNALETAAHNAAGGKTALVSVNIEILAPGAEGAPEVTIARKTKTLVFLRADLRSIDGTHIAIADSVHKLLS